MPLPRVSISVFLSSARTALISASKKDAHVTLVVGNESADLDSICSSVLLAYLRTTESNHTNTNKPTTYIPLCNLPRSDLALRPELSPVLSRANVKPSELITLSELPISDLVMKEKGHIKWVLVDHNSLQGELGVFRDRVKGVIDHHEDERVVSERGLCEREGEMRVIEKCGSCASLVVGWARRGWETRRKSEERDGLARRVDAELAWLALGPILIDTTCLRSKDKTTKADTEAVEWLEGIIRGSENETEGSDQEVYDREKYFEQITREKENIGNLEFRDILRKDYKQWNEGGVNLGISSVVKDINWLIEKAGGRDEFLKGLESWAKEKELGICAVMTTSNPGGQFRRELLVWGFDQSGAGSVRKFQSDASEKLGLKVWGDGDLDVRGEGQLRFCWRQEKLEHSRKQVGPLLRTAMK